MTWLRDLIAKVIRVNGVEQIDRRALHLEAGPGVTLEAQDRPAQHETRVKISMGWTVVGSKVIDDTSYTLQLEDNFTQLIFTSASPVTVTVPPDSSLAWPDDVKIVLFQRGDGQVSVTGNVVVEPGFEAKLRAKITGAALQRAGADSWELWGALEESV